jgi:hypothetical protein
MPCEFVALLVAFAPLFSKPVFHHVQVLLLGARWVKKLKYTIFPTFTGLPSPAPHLAIHCAMAHTPHQ